MDCEILKLKIIRIMCGSENNIMQAIIEWIKGIRLGKKIVWLSMIIFLDYVEQRTSLHITVLEGTKRAIDLKKEDILKLIWNNVK